MSNTLWTVFSLAVLMLGFAFGCIAHRFEAPNAWSSQEAKRAFEEDVCPCCQEAGCRPGWRAWQREEYYAVCDR